MRQIIISWTSLFFFGLFSLTLTAQDIKFKGQAYDFLCEGSQWCANIELSEEIQDVETLNFTFSWDATYLTFEHINLDAPQITHPLPSEGALSFLSDSTTFLIFEWEGTPTTLSGVIAEVCWTVEAKTISEQFAQIILHEAVAITPTIVVDNVPQIEFIYINSPEIQLSSQVFSLLHDQVCIPVMGLNFAGVDAMAFSLQWDGSLLAFNSINLDNSDLDGLQAIDFLSSTAGQLSMTWNALDEQYISNPNNVFLYKVCFDVLAQEEVETLLSVAGDNPELPLFVSTACQETVEPYTFSSTLRFTEQAMSLSFPDTTISIHTDLLCIPTVANNDQEIVGLQLAMLWDEEVLRFNSLKLDQSELYGISEGNFNTTIEGQVLMSWMDPAILGVQVEQDDILFESCFDIIGEVDTETLIYLGADSLGIITEASTFDEVIGVLDIPGMVRIRAEERFIFPGDTNEDKKANHFDLLNIGLGYKYVGTKRANTNTNWERKYSRDWAEATNLSNINFKHSDANGDSEIDKEDVEAILQNWGQEANITGDVYEPNGYIGTSAIAVAAPVNKTGTIMSLPILLGTDDYPTENAYGLAFSISYAYDSELLNIDDLTLALNDSWLGELDRDLIAIQKHFPEEQRIDIAITRIDHASRGGQGQIATFDLIVEDVILLISNPEDSTSKNIDVKIHDIRLISEKEEAIAIADVEVTFDLSEVSTSVQTVGKSKVAIHPTITQDYLHITSEINTEKAIVFDMNGKQLQQFEHPSSRLDVQTLTTGSYLLQVLTKEGYTTHYFTIQ